MPTVGRGSQATRGGSAAASNPWLVSRVSRSSCIWKKSEASCERGAVEVALADGATGPRSGKRWRRNVSRKGSQGIAPGAPSRERLPSICASHRAATFSAPAGPRACSYLECLLKGSQIVSVGKHEPRLRPKSRSLPLQTQRRQDTQRRKANAAVGWTGRLWHGSQKACRVAADWLTSSTSTGSPQPISKGNSAPLLLHTTNSSAEARGRRGGRQPRSACKPHSNCSRWSTGARLRRVCSRSICASDFAAGRHLGASSLGSCHCSQLRKSRRRTIALALPSNRCHSFPSKASKSPPEKETSMTRNGSPRLPAGARVRARECCLSDLAGRRERQSSSSAQGRRCLSNAHGLRLSPRHNRGDQLGSCLEAGSWARAGCRRLRSPVLSDGSQRPSCLTPARPQPKGSAGWRSWAGRPPIGALRLCCFGPRARASGGAEATGARTEATRSVRLACPPLARQRRDVSDSGANQPVHLAADSRGPG